MYTQKKTRIHAHAEDKSLTALPAPWSSPECIYVYIYTQKHAYMHTQRTYHLQHFLPHEAVPSFSLFHWITGRLPVCVYVCMVMCMYVVVIRRIFTSALRTPKNAALQAVLNTHTCIDKLFIYICHYEVWKFEVSQHSLIIHTLFVHAKVLQHVQKEFQWLIIILRAHLEMRLFRLLNPHTYTQGFCM
jgi:hypothetical protein